MGTLNCDNCGGFSKCTNACYMHLGKALVDFITGIDVVETRIGEFSSTKMGGKLDLIVSGHQLYNDGESGWILTDISTTIDSSDKFKSAYEMNVFQIATKYLERTEKTPEEKDEILNKIRQINKNKLFIVPFKPNTMCIIEYNDGHTVVNRVDAQIHSIRWSNNKENHKFDITVLFEVENMPSKIQKHNISTYLDKFSLAQIDMQTRTPKINTKIISIDNNGIIKPIIFKQDNIQIAVDGSYVYQINPQGISIIGVWGTGDKLYMNNSIKLKAIEKLKDNETFIKCHRKYIAPYMLYEPNVIEV